MNEMIVRNESASAICEWLSAGFDKNWESNLQEPYVMLSISRDHAEHLPLDVMQWAVGWTLPAGILAKHYLGHDIPERDDD